MAIEGPLRELGIHDVFQLLDLSRKTGTLAVTSELRDNEGTVYFDAGKVIYATIKSNPHPLGLMLVKSGRVTEADLDRALLAQKSRPGVKFGAILVEMGVITPRELERQVKLQIEEVVFELMSWREGFFSFTERDMTDVPAGATVQVSTESLLMEGARRIDEWSRIADKVPHLAVIPVLADVSDAHSAQLELLPNEWEMLSMIDGGADLREIAAALVRSEFDVARIAYGLVSTGIVTLRMPSRVSTRALLPVDDATPHLTAASAALAENQLEAALVAARQAIAADPGSVDGRLLAGRALLRLGHLGEAVDELRRGAQLDPSNPAMSLELAFAAARAGHFAEALERWQRYLAEMPASPLGPRVRAAIEATRRLTALIEEHASV
ncbi:MAG: DUF4388 domain-containing protein [Gemmatimonadetes bacterium]|nr:DUF4388 domain-containing protein [Gemmatimonadota bacterium]